MHLSGHGNVKTFLPQLSGWFKRKSWSDWRDSLFLRSFEGHFPFCSQRTIGKVYQKMLQNKNNKSTKFIAFSRQFTRYQQILGWEKKMFLVLHYTCQRKEVLTSVIKSRVLLKIYVEIAKLIDKFIIINFYFGGPNKAKVL